MFATVAPANKDVPISDLVQSKKMKKRDVAARRLGRKMRYIDSGYNIVVYTDPEYPQQDGGYVQAS